VDYNEVMESMGSVAANDESVTKKPITVKRKKKASVVEGGC
jgi:hypothetical protein